MHDPHLEMLRKAGVKIPGLTDRKKPFTAYERQITLGRFQARNTAMLKAAGFEDDDLDYMADDILRGYRNSGLHYKDFHRTGQNYDLYQRLFGMLSRELQNYRWYPSGLVRPRVKRQPLKKDSV